MKCKIDNHTVQTTWCPPSKNRLDIWDSHLPGFVISIRQSGSKVYFYRYRDAYNRQRAIKIGNAADLTCDQARKMATKFRSSVVMGQNPAETKQIKKEVPTFKQLADRYLERAKETKKSWDIDERYLRLHIVKRFGSLHLDQIKQADILSWLDEMERKGYAPATLNRWHVIMGAAYRLAQRWQVPGSSVNPLQGLPHRRTDNELDRFLNAEETARLKEAVEASANPQLKYVVAILILTGVRKRELLDARWEHFDLEKRLWLIPTSKSGKPRTLPIPQAAMDVLVQLPRFDKCPFVVPNPATRKPFTSIFNSWNTARLRAGLPDVKLHTLRHSFASNLVNSGQSLVVVAKLLGHAANTGMQMTRRYSHLSQETLMTAAEAGAAMTGVNWQGPN